MNIFSKGELPVLCLVHLPKYLTQTELKRKLVLHQGIRSVKIPMDVIKGENKGFAFLTFTCEEKALNFLTKGSIQIDGREVTIRDMHTWNQLSGKYARDSKSEVYGNKCTVVIREFTKEDIPSITNHLKQYGPVVGVSCSNKLCNNLLAITFKYPDSAYEAAAVPLHRVSPRCHVSCIRLCNYLRHQPKKKSKENRTQRQEGTWDLNHDYQDHSRNVDRQKVMYVAKRDLLPVGDRDCSHDKPRTSSAQERSWSSIRDVPLLHKRSNETGDSLEKVTLHPAANQLKKKTGLDCLSYLSYDCHKPTSLRYRAANVQAIIASHLNAENLKFHVNC